ncbi:hypothetical protein H072_6995 [Dactylellina haptotyla CBS 200.50]|uniref:Uncharacterized protein n=1 Tax=Dactylellina haptotyla (strain CBS 200.50) TaxID=1284197 RepID=S8BV93_DACHA|nr:hypothetical protein H072_6995 [Dactylellina haptotyla CBS 200.50]
MNGSTPSTSRPASSHPQSVDEVIADINTAIDKLTDKFNTASQEFFGRLDEISTRLDVLEQSILASHTTSELGDDTADKKENGSDTAGEPKD